MARKEFKVGDKAVVTRELKKAKHGEEIVVISVKEESFFLKGEVEGTTKDGSRVTMLMDDVVKRN